MKGDYTEYPNRKLSMGFRMRRYLLASGWLQRMSDMLFEDWLTGKWLPLKKAYYVQLRRKSTGNTWL